MSEFFNQGAVPLSSTAYVSRLFEDAVYQEIISNRWVLLLGPRQHGKSTGLVRLRKKFIDAQLIVCRADLQRLPPCEHYAQLLKAISAQLGKSIGADAIASPHRDGQTDFLSWLNVVLPQGTTPIVIIIDECATIENAVFRNSFYGQIRQINSQQADAERTDIAARIRFIFSGTFRPETLVSEQNSPFNVCQLVNTDDLTLDQARELATNVHPEVIPFVEAAFEVVGGQPFLLQTIFLETTRITDLPFEDAFTGALNEIRALAAGHLEGIFSKVIANPSLVEKVSAMVKDGHTGLIPADSDCSFLQTIGLTKRDGTRLVFRNKLYNEVAAESPLLPPSQQTKNADVPVFGLEPDSLKFMKAADFRQAALSAYNGSANAHQNRNYRLALIGFGSAMEAVLIDFLTGLSATSINAAIAAASADADHTKRTNFNRWETQTDPRTWRLVNLINVARKVQVGTMAPEPSHALRDWRNLVHPALAVQHYPDESKLMPESVAAAALFMMLIRDVSEIS